MKKLLLLGMITLSMHSYSQLTYVPDDNFEAHLEANGMGNGTPNDDYVTTSNINGVTNLYVDFKNISDLTGIEDFTSLYQLGCMGNQLTSLDLSQNTALSILDCGSNPFTSLDLSQNLALINLNCVQSDITSLDLTQNIALTHLYCVGSLITSLDLSQNAALVYLRCNGGQLNCLNIKNGNNLNFTEFTAKDNPNLTCIEVDNVTWWNANFAVVGDNLDAQTSVSSNCGNACSTIVGLEEVSITNKHVLKIVDLMGRETTPVKNTILIYIYSNGSSERIFQTKIK